MFQPDHPQSAPWTDRLRAGMGRRVGGFLIALAVELLILLALLSFSIAPKMVSQQGETLSVFSVTPENQETAEPEPEPASASQPQPMPPEAAPAKAEPTEVRPLPWATVPTQPMPPPDAPAVPDRPAKPAAPARPMMGPPDRGVPGDSQRVGTAPNGQPLYGAAWYREPYDDELSGYLSTARGPGWALIACKTVPDFRVEDCVFIDEYPAGSGIARSVLAAAWQFRVRPPRVGGLYRVGEWVRIRIDYNLRRQ